ncbi:MULTISPECIES: ABC transporter substrate-binding protein [unclassified Achromobacter]|uniref:ABC transporter substrate-binding protein n=1 Tax=unclassified Achromobacter TaxID=2626865 RepID=UPI000B51BB5A|nr:MULTISPECIES: ABC transporter substrate-binding protein [unclassified Achromobacter]OWT75008.1 ABC transporter permease [Achromobacter sp. HZ28]OWT76617.1 ABC transporter permease [Achromobacter sp. HZ34]
MRLGNRAGAALVFCAALIATTFPSHAADGVKIGVLTDMAGVTADATGKGSVEAARLAVEEAGGKVLGPPIEIVVGDHQHRPDIGSSMARRWFDVDKVSVIVDVPNSAVALAVQGIAKEKKKLVLFSSPGTTALTQEQCSPYGFQWTYTTYALSRGTANAVVREGNKRWFILASDYAFGKQLAADTTAVVKAAGGEVAGTVYHPLNASDFASFLLQAQASKAQIIAIANAGGDTIAAIKQAAEFGINRGSQKLAAMLLLLTDVHSLGLDVAQSTYLTVPSYWDMNEGTRAFSKKFEARVGHPPTFLQAGVYSAVRHYLKAVAAAGTADSDAVAAKMKELPIDDPFSLNAHIRADGLVVRDMMLAQVKTPAQSKAPWDYYNVVRTIPGSELAWPLSESKCPLIHP